MFEEIDVIKARRVPLIYRCPPFCEAEFSSTAEPTIVLSPIRRRRGPTGLRISDDGGIVTLSWDTVDGAICYNVYAVINFGQPDQSYVLIAECITEPNIVVDCPSPPCNYVVTVITPDGESDPSDPVVDDGPGEVCLLRIKNYGSILEPFFNGPTTTPPPASTDDEWDGIWNFLIAGSPAQYWYKGSNELFFRPNIAVDGKKVSQIVIIGPLSPTDIFLSEYWQVEVKYESESGPLTFYNTWVGVKVGGDTSSPAGIYINRDTFPEFGLPSNSDSRLSIEVEFCEF